MVSDFAKILKVGILPALGASPAEEEGIKGWIVKQSYVPSLTDKTLKLERVNLEKFSEAITFDFERFALSAQESLIVALSEYNRFGSIGWPLLKIYYSAFFSAHAIMRSRGAGVIKLEREQATKITTIVNMFSNGSAVFQSGVYNFQFQKGPNDGVGEGTVILAPSKEGRGVHEGFWEMFTDYIEDQAKRAAEQQLPDHRDFVDYATNLKTAVLSGGRGAAWFSEVRNNLNYQHQYEAWMPYRKKSQSHLAMPTERLAGIQYARLDISKTKEPVKAFLCLACYLAHLNADIAEHVATRAKGGRAFGQKWQRLKSAAAPNAA